MKIAIFDLDGTISEGPSGADLAKKLEELKIIKPGFIETKKKLEDDYHAGKIDYNDILAPYLASINKSFEGVEFTSVYKFTKVEYKPINFIYEWVSPLFEELHKRNYLIVIVSASFDFYIEVLQDDLDFDTFYATALELNEGKFSGECRIPITDIAKANYIKQLKIGNEIIVIGDSKGDVPMMELADKAYYFAHKNGKNLREKPELQNLKVVTHEDISEVILGDM